MQYHNASLEAALPLLSSVNKENCSELFLFGILALFFNLASPKKEDDILVVGNGVTPEWLYLLRGTEALIDAQEDALRASSVSLIFRSSEDMVNLLQNPPSGDTPGISILESAIMAYTKHDLPKQTLLLEVIGRLKRSYALLNRKGFSDTDRMIGFIDWLFDLSDGYFKLLRDGDSEALCVLAYFTVLIKQLEVYWWAEGWAIHLIRRIYMVLDTEHRFTIRWPIEEIGWVPDSAAMAKEQITPAGGVKVVALHPIDQRAPVGQIRTLVFFVVREVLDQDLLRDSLDKLIRQHLPILGARLKPATKKGLLEEYHYPQPYPDDAVLFAWSERSIESTLNAAKLIPDVSSTSAVSWGRPVTDLEATWTPSGWPLQRKDDKPDTPLLLVHLTSYNDATVLSLNIPHAVADQKGVASMVEAWLAVAQGKTPPPFIQLKPGALDGPKDLPASVLQRKGEYRPKTKGEFIRLIVGVLPDLVRNREEDRRVLFLSAEVVTRLRDKCNKELREKYGSEHAILTNGDIVTSVLLSYLHRKRIKTLSLGETVNARGRHPAFPQGQHYIHNCPAYACARFKFNKDTPLSEIAHHHRLAVNETASLENIERSFAVTKKVFEGAYGFPYGEPGDLSYSVTNWSSAWHSIEFSHVIKGRKENGAANGTVEVAGVKPPMLVFGHAQLPNNNIHRLHSVVMCKGDGGYWADYSCSTNNMALVEELLKRDPLLNSF
ncbi:Acetyltransferase BOT5 [Paramyrothecium foliicola]|nr:Acetyltransferase BOT5 [Paramyrothecium foliicola]